MRCGGGTRALGGGASCLGAGHPGWGALPPQTTCPFGRADVAQYPLAVGAGAAGVGTCHQPHSVCSCELALRAVGAARGCLGGGALAWVWSVRGRALSHPQPLVLSNVRRGFNTRWLWVRGVQAWGPVTNPTACALASWLCALWGRHEGARGGRLLPGCWVSGVGRYPTPDHSSFGACGRGPLPTGCGYGGCGRSDPSPTPQRALLRAGFARCGGGTRAPGGGASCLGVGRPGTGALPPLTYRPFGPAAGARFPLAVGAVCGGRGLAVLETFSRAAVPRVLCAPPGFAAPGGRCCLASVVVFWLWPAACLSGVPRGPALVCRASSGPIALGAPVGFPVAVVPFPTPGAVAPGFTAWLRGARGGRPGTGLFVPAAGPCQGKGAGRAPRRTRSGPRDGVVPGESLRLRSWAACAAVVWRVWTRSLTRPVSRTVRLSTRTRPVHRGCFVWTPTPPLLRRRTPRPGSACVCVRAPLRWVRRAGLPGAFWCALPFPVAVLSFFFVRPPLGQGSPRFWWIFFLAFFPSFFPLSSHPPLAPPAVSGFLCFPALGALGLGALCFCSVLPPPPVLLFFLVVFPLLHPTYTLSHPRPLVSWGVRPGPTTHWLWVQGVRAFGPVTNPTARALARWLCALWGPHQGARGGRLLPRCGASGDWRSPAPDLSSFRACGRGPLPTGRGCGVRASGPGCP